MLASFLFLSSVSMSQSSLDLVSLASEETTDAMLLLDASEHGRAAQGWSP